MNHDKMSTMDKLWVIGELEHIRTHCITSALSVENEDEKFFYIVSAHQAMEYRREWQAKYFPNVTEYDWCLVKASMHTKQLLYETLMENSELASKINDLTTSLLSHATGEDLSSCESCRKDMMVEE